MAAAVVFRVVPPPRAEAGRERLDVYELGDKLGEGACAKVVAVHDTRSDGHTPALACKIYRREKLAKMRFAYGGASVDDGIAALPPLMAPVLSPASLMSAAAAQGADALPMPPMPGLIRPGLRAAGADDLPALLPSMPPPMPSILPPMPPMPNIAAVGDAGLPPSAPSTAVDGVTQLCAEVRAMRDVASPYVLRVHDAMESSNGKFYVVVDRCMSALLTAQPAPGDSDSVRFVRPCVDTLFTEHEARHVARCLFTGLVALHDAAIAHMDIKPENVMLRARPGGDVPWDAVIVDLGLCRRGAQMHTRDSYGTLAFSPPECFQSISFSGARYDARKADVWAAAVTVFACFTGALPFSLKSRVTSVSSTDHRDADAVLPPTVDPATALRDSKSLSESITSDDPVWPVDARPSAAFQHWMNTLLSKAPEDRPTAEQALQLPWLGDSVGDV